MQGAEVTKCKITALVTDRFLSPGPAVPVVWCSRHPLHRLTYLTPRFPWQRSISMCI